MVATLPSNNSAYTAIVRGVGETAGVALVGLIALLLGITQDSLLPGGAHWVIQVLHLLLGVAAVGSGEMIGGRLRRMRLAASAA